MLRALTFWFAVVVGSLTGCTSPCEESLEAARRSVDFAALRSNLETAKIEADTTLSAKGPECESLEAEQGKVDAYLEGFREQIEEAKMKGSDAQKKLESRSRSFQDGVDATVAVMALKMGQSTTMDGRSISYRAYLKPDVEAVVGAYFEQRVAEQLLSEHREAELDPARAAVRACHEARDEAKATSDAAVSARAAIDELAATVEPKPGDFDQPLTNLKAALPDLPQELVAPLQVAAATFSGTATTCNATQ